MIVFVKQLATSPGGAVKTLYYLQYRNLPAAVIPKHLVTARCSSRRWASCIQARTTTLKRADTIMFINSNCLLVTTVFMVGCLSFAYARTTSVGSLAIPYGIANNALGTDPRSPTSMPGACARSATADFGYRNSLAQYSTSAQDTRWGPHLNWYPQLEANQVPDTCNPTAWAWHRILAAVQMTNAMDLNYCHHHAPSWYTPLRYQVWCDSTEPGADNDNCVCSKAGSFKANAWRGVDCSNYAAWLYNYAFGYYPTSAIGSMACSDSAPGQILDKVTTANLDQMNPGDLLFITLGRTGRTPPVRVSHVVVWTGWTVDFTPGANHSLSYNTLVQHLPSSQLASAISCINARRAQGMPVYVITDSTHTGPNLRPFCGWYMSSFSHARRIINPDLNLFQSKNNASVTKYSSSKNECLSYWALQT